MANLFDTIPSTFFSLLASPNRRVYVDCIFIIYRAIDSIEDAFQGDREFIVGKLIDYFDDHLLDEFEDVEEEELAHTSRQKATHVISVLKKHGWLGEEELGDYKTSLNLFDYSIRIIDLLEKIEQNVQPEYTGEIFAVYSLLASFSIEEGIGVLEQAAIKTDDIMRKLKALKANIYRFYYDITKKHQREDLQDLLNKLLVEYKENFFDSAYYNLKTTDSLSRYKRGILESVNRIINNEETMDMLALNVMSIKHIEDYNEGYQYVEDKLRSIANNFKALEYLITAIDKKNEQYVSAATSKILFFTNQSDDIEGIFNRLFQIILSKTEVDYSMIFRLVQTKNLDTDSLYNQRRARQETVVEEINYDDDLIPEALRTQKIKALLKNNIYGKKEIDRFVQSLLKKDEVVEAKDIPLETQEDYVKLILIFLYSKSIGMHYQIEMTGNTVTHDFVTFQNFLIKGLNR